MTRPKLWLVFTGTQTEGEFLHILIYDMFSYFTELN